jgi:hypothetical protein
MNVPDVRVARGGDWSHVQPQDLTESNLMRLESVAAI